VKGNLKLLALKYLEQEEELSGKQITTRIENGTGWTPSPGTFYPLLDRLEEEGFLESWKEGRERKFRITDEGCKKFREFQEEQEKYWGQIIQSLKNYKEMFDQEELDDFIRQLEKARDSDYTFSYPVMVSHRITDLLSLYNDLDKKEKDEINQIMDETHEKIREIVK